MEISVLDFLLINSLSYIFGVATGLIICCKNKDKFLVKSRSLENLSMYNTSRPPTTNPQNYNGSAVIATAATAPPSKVSENKQVKITLE